MSADRRFTLTTTEGTERTSWKCTRCPANGTRTTLGAALAAAEAHDTEHHPTTEDR